jgi:ATP-dependent Clp protease ATP-binding subunit ClpC
VAARVLASLGITVEEVRAKVVRIVGQGDEAVTGQIPFTPRAKAVLESALREALSLNHNYVGSEHILLGLVRENESVAARILLDFPADAATLRDQIIRAGPRQTGEDFSPPGEEVWLSELGLRRSRACRTADVRRNLGRQRRDLGSDAISSRSDRSARVSE